METRIKQFYDDNTHEVNLIIAKCLAVCALVPVALLICTWTGIFNFNAKLKAIIIVVGFLTTLGPIALVKINATDRIVKYYCLVMLSLLIGLLGTENGIGIYISYVMVPIASCLYFDKRFTLRITVLSYITMTLGVYFNCANKLEVRYMNWSHMITFRNYMIGFTLEYLAVMLFVYQVIKRAQQYLESQFATMANLQDEMDKIERVAAIYQGTATNQKTTAMNMIVAESSNLTPECYVRLAAGHQFVAGIQDSLTYSSHFREDLMMVLAKVGEYFGLDRILYIEGAREEDNIILSYQWNRNDDTYISEFRRNFDNKAYQDIAAQYDELGYLEIYKSETLFEDVMKDMDSKFTRYIADIMLEAQLWIPTLAGGEYVGAVCYEKNDRTPYSIVDKSLLSEVGGIIAAHVNRMNSDAANQAKSDFLSSMSHEIRTPMNAIIGMANVALREEMSDEVRKDLNIIKSSSEGLLGIINDILDFSKIESGKIDIIDDNYSILSLMNDVITIANARNVDKNLTINYHIPDNLPATLLGDAVRIKQVMVNLATNAIKYTKEGSVDISVAIEHRDDSDLLVYSVKDTGIGIREEDKKKLFKSFSQIDQKKNHTVEGTGLGLAISKQLVELMGGKIGLESEYGKGSTFFFEIPQVIVDAAPAGNITEYEYEDSQAKMPDFSAPDAKILIVDDNEMNLMVAEALFEPFGMSITTASSGFEALELVKSNKYDMIFMDHFMPGKDGVETMHEIRALDGNPNQSAPIVALTADALADVKERLLAEGMNDFLAKPIDMKLAVKVMRKYL